MSIIKSKHAGNFTVLPNEIFKQKLSLEAIGLLACLLKLPSDWVIQKSYLHIQLDMGRDKLDRVFKELQEKGFILTVKEFDDKGRFTYNHIVYDKPFNGEEYKNPSAESPSTENPSMVDLQLQNKDIQKKENKINNIEERKLKFASTLNNYLDIYPKETIDKFIAYWSESNKSNTKFKYELERTWDLERRLNTWISNENKFNFAKPKDTNNTPNTYREL
jgi:hypothetical protein